MGPKKPIHVSRSESRDKTGYNLDIKFAVYLEGRKVIGRNTLIYEACLYKCKRPADEHIYMFIYIYI